jgi:hypothetical protein
VPFALPFACPGWTTTACWRRLCLWEELLRLGTTYLDVDGEVGQALRNNVYPGSGSPSGSGSTSCKGGLELGLLLGERKPAEM